MPSWKEGYFQGKISDPYYFVAAELDGDPAVSGPTTVIVTVTNAHPLDPSSSHYYLSIGIKGMAFGAYDNTTDSDGNISAYFTSIDTGDHITYSLSGQPNQIGVAAVFDNGFWAEELECGLLKDGVLQSNELLVTIQFIGPDHTGYSPTLDPCTDITLDNLEFTDSGVRGMINWTPPDPPPDEVIINDEDGPISTVPWPNTGGPIPVEDPDEPITVEPIDPPNRGPQAPPVPLIGVLNLNKEPSSLTYSEVDEVITYTFTLRNVDDRQIDGPFFIKDTILGEFEVTVGGNPIDHLDPDEFVTFNKDYTITADDITNESVSNDAMAIGFDGMSPPVNCVIVYESETPPEIIEITGSGGFGLAGAGIIALVANPSGLYTIQTGKRCDTLWDRAAGGLTSQDVQIPEPYAITGFIDADS